MPRQTCWEKYCWHHRGWWGASWSWPPCAGAAGSRWPGCRAGERTPTRPQPWWTQSGFSSSYFQHEGNKCNPAQWSSISFYITILAWSSEPTEQQQQNKKQNKNLRAVWDGFLKPVSGVSILCHTHTLLLHWCTREPTTRRNNVRLWTR